MISVITPVFNSSKTISCCINSVKEQTLFAEHIVIDGGSTDGSLSILEAHLQNPSFYISGPDQGIYDAINKGISLAKGDVIGILHSDDFYASTDVLQKVANLFQDQKIGACYGDLVYVPANTSLMETNDSATKVVRYWRSGEYKRDKFYWGWMPPHPTLFVRRQLYEEKGLYRLDLGSAADYELILRFLLKHRIKTAYIPQTLVTMRVGGVSNASYKNRLAAHKMDGKAWLINGLKPYPWTLMLKPIRKIGQWFLK